MAVKVRVRNFQAIKDAEITVDGLTAITGPNNTGKSAMLRAIRGVFQNTRGTAFVRHGADKAIVELEFEDGRKVRWEKGPKTKPTYILDGDEKHPIHPGQGVPDEVKALGVHPIVAGGRDVWPQVAPQLNGQVFLLDEPGSVLAEAVANVDRVGRLNRALKASERDRRSTASELKVRRSDKDKQEAEVESYTGLDEAVAEVGAIEEAAAKAARIGRAIVKLKALRDRVVQAREAVEALEGIESVEVPTLGDLPEVLDELEDRVDLRDRLAQARGSVEALAGVEAVDVPPVGDLRDQLRELTTLVSLRDRLGSARDRVARYEGVGSVEVDIDVRPAEKLAIVGGTLRVLRDRINHFKTRIGLEQKLLEEKEAELIRVEVEIQETLGDLGECPTCGEVVAHTH